MSIVKTEARRYIVEARYKARKIWERAIEEMPDTITVRNNKEGRREPHDVDISKTVEWLGKIGGKIFRRNLYGHYVAISLDDPRRISFAPEPDLKFDSSRRVITTVQRYVSRNFGMDYPLINERGLEMLAEKFRAASQEDWLTHFKVVSGDEIVEKYRDCWGGGTCMTGEESWLTRVYARNDDVCSMLVYDDRKGTKARALLWETIQGDKFCDRIYPNSGPHIEVFKMYCDKHDLVQRIGNGHPTSVYDPDYCDPPTVRFTSGEAYTVRVLKHPAEDVMPFTDSFHWGMDQGNTLLLGTDGCDERREWELVFNSTCGEINHFSQPTCTYCGTLEAAAEGTLRTEDGGWWCRDCYDEEFFKCERCGYHRRIETNRVEVIVNTAGDEAAWCHSCVRRYARACSECTEYVSAEIGRCDDKNDYCPECWETRPIEAEEQESESA